MNDLEMSTIALTNQEAIPVFKKYGLDFCCHGSMKLAFACSEKGLSIYNIVKEITEAGHSKGLVMPFTEMSAAELISHIITHHHFFVKKQMPYIDEHLQTIVARHGEHYPYLKQLLVLFSGIREELTTHMYKEEEIVFPTIIETEKQFLNKEIKTNPPENKQADVENLEKEHAHAGEILEKIRSITNNYNAPRDACTTFILTYAELKAFEEDLHMHVHLENNILFPLTKNFGVTAL